tara:strand:- start:1528 stop:2811 length:1284 start_codon:yes stop_codon:yes gene_type:complete
VTPEELRKQQLRAGIARAMNGPPPSTLKSIGEDVARAGMTAGTTSAFTNDLDARINAEAMAKTFAGQESNIIAQRARAKRLRDKGMPEARMVGQGEWATLMQPNWGEQLRGVTNTLLGGYLEGQAGRDAEQLDVDQTEQASLVKSAEEEIRLEGLALDAENRKEDNDYREKGLQIQKDEAAARTLRENARIAEANARRIESLRRYNEQLGLDENKTESANEKLTRTGVMAYGKEVIKSGIPKANSNMGYLKDLLGDYAEQDSSGQWILKEGVTEIPGIGGFSNAPAYIGDAITWAADLTRNTSEIDGIGKAIRQGAQKVYNTEIKDLSGSAVSAHEMLRNLKAQGVDIWSSPENFLLGINAISDGYVSVQNTIDAMTDPEYVAIYNQRLNPPSEEVTEKTVIRTGIDKATNERVTEWSDRSVTREPL